MIDFAKHIAPGRSVKPGMLEVWVVSEALSHTTPCLLLKA
jgi:hypothetical protein